jgi:protein TonB
MIYFDVLPSTTLKSFLVAPPPPPPPPPPPAQVVKAVKAIPRQFDAGRLMAPKAVPKQIAEIKEDEAPPPSAGGLGVVGGVPGGVAGGATGGVLGSILDSAPRQVSVLPPPPPPKKEEKKEVAPTRVRVGGNVQAGLIQKRIQPVYPPLAKQARIQGTVILSAMISKEGTIQNLTVTSGHALLIQAALDAVKQWTYKPYLLNGEPVEVSTEIEVHFTLNQ